MSIKIKGPDGSVKTVTPTSRGISGSASSAQSDFVKRSDEIAERATKVFKDRQRDLSQIKDTSLRKSAAAKKFPS